MRDIELEGITEEMAKSLERALIECGYTPISDDYVIIQTVRSDSTSDIHTWVLGKENPNVVVKCNAFTLVVHNEEMLKDKRVRELLLEYII